MPRPTSLRFPRTTHPARDAVVARNSRTAPLLAAATVLALTLGAVFGAAPASAAPDSAAGAPPSPAVVAARLGANRIPAELVILVDVSESMKWDGLYPVVQRELPLFLAELKKQDPSDTVAIVAFGARQDTRTVYLGPPRTTIGLPANPASKATDFGYAFQTALDILGRASARVKVGGVLLLSDGTLNALGDPQYAGYSAPGWASLRSRARGLGMTLTGYGLPLRKGQAGIDSVNRALGAVFRHREILSANFGDLGHELGVARTKIMNERVVSAVQPDRGKGIRVAWSGLSSLSGMPALDLGSGSADLRLTLTAMTHAVPLNLSRLVVAATGFPVPVSGVVPAGPHSLAPGQSITVPVHLTWQPLRRAAGQAAPPAAHGRLTVTGRVSSPFTAAIRHGFGYRKFTVGGLTGAASTAVLGVVPGPVNYGSLLVVLLVVLLAAALVLGLRTQVGGRLILVAPGHAPAMLTLHRLPSMSRSTEELLGVPGRITVRGTVRRKRMRIHLRLGEENSTVEMKPWDQAFIGGVQVIHEPTRGGPRGGRPESNPSEDWPAEV